MIPLKSMVLSVEVEIMKNQGKTLPKDMLPLFDELEGATAVKYRGFEAKELTLAKRIFLRVSPL
jgi:hypothetical protein